MDHFASFIEYYLPVFIPVFLTIISVLSGIVTKRIQLTLNSLLKIHSDIVLGLFSFVIWALVAYQQTGTIQLNKFNHAQSHSGGPATICQYHPADCWTNCPKHSLGS